MHKRMSLHGDVDHCGNSKSLIDSFNVKKVYLNKGKINNCEKKQLSKSIISFNFIFDCFYFDLYR